MTVDQTLEILKVYEHIAQHNVNWDEINRVYKYFPNNSIETSALSLKKVLKIKLFVEENGYDIQQAKYEEFQRNRRFYAVLLKREFPFYLPFKRKEWINKNIFQTSD